MTTCVPRRSPSFWPTSRPTVSVLPPGANPTISRIGLLGNVCCAAIAAVEFNAMTVATIDVTVLMASSIVMYEPCGGLQLLYAFLETSYVRSEHAHDKTAPTAATSASPPTGDTSPHETQPHEREAARRRASIRRLGHDSFAADRRDGRGSRIRLGAARLRAWHAHARE